MMGELDNQQCLTRYIGQETEYWDFWGAIRIIKGGTLQITICSFSFRWGWSTPCLTTACLYTKTSVYGGNHATADKAMP